MTRENVEYGSEILRKIDGYSEINYASSPDYMGEDPVSILNRLLSDKYPILTPDEKMDLFRKCVNFLEKETSRLKQYWNDKLEEI